MKKILSTFLMSTLLLTFVGVFNVEATDINGDLPKEVIEEMEKTNKDLETLKEGFYKVGEQLFVDVSKIELEDIKSEEIQTFATSMPTSVWDWSDGTYYARYSMDYSATYTSYGFTGYDRYSVYVSETSRTPSGHANEGYIGLELRTGTGKGTIVNEANSGGKGNIGISFINCNPRTTYAFVVTKANDGTTSKGAIEVD